MRPSSPLPLRERHKEATRDIILRAAADIVASRGIHTFTVQEVADRAGISHRSVYRYFPTREALVEGLYTFAEQMALPWASNLSPVLEDVPVLAVNPFVMFDREPNIIRASVMARLTTGYQPQARIQRTKAFAAGMRRLTPNLDTQEFRRTFALLRLLVSSNAWLVFREDFGLSGEEMTKAVSWAVSVLIQDLKRRNRAAAGNRKRRGRHG
ncbi:MAG TPA: helix-turn-helix domain-containing protein [Thermoplasmata archaeon]|nr:helix-turn-helix domain-containing protein [Thermoplasmata archaeon]